VHLQKERIDPRGDFGTIPTVLGDWRRFGTDAIENAETLESLGTTQYLTRSYALEGDPRKGVINLHIAYYTGVIDTVPHIPERCAYASGLLSLGEPERLVLDIEYPPDPTEDGAVNRSTGQKYAYALMTDPVTRQVVRVPMPVGEMALTLTRFQNPKSPSIEQLFGYFFIANGGVTSSTFDVRKLAFKLSDRFAYYCKVQVSTAYAEDPRSAKDRYQEQVGGFIKVLMPYLMRILPDWPALEASEAAPKSTS
ncbi:MAG: exosortase-associated EpsI family protein, partial [Phycisphaerae bacterium]|nr:exosortase-associated EpsI family protein [Phycisphaerae bacterium]